MSVAPKPAFMVLIAISEPLLAPIMRREGLMDLSQLGEGGLSAEVDL